MARYRVECITKPNRLSANSRIQRLGGTLPFYWNKSEDEVIADIQRGDQYYTMVDGIEAALEIARGEGDRPYLKTVADHFLRDNLLQLKECGLLA